MPAAEVEVGALVEIVDDAEVAGAVVGEAAPVVLPEPEDASHENGVGPEHMQISTSRRNAMQRP